MDYILENNISVKIPECDNCVMVAQDNVLIHRNYMLKYLEVNCHDTWQFTFKTFSQKNHVGIHYASFATFLKVYKF